MLLRDCIVLAVLQSLVLDVNPAWSQSPVRFQDEQFVSDVSTHTGLGTSIAAEDGVIVASNPGHDAASYDSGVLWRLDHGSGGFSHVDTLAADDVFNLRLASSLDLHGTQLVAGSSLFGFPSNITGRVYVFDLTAAGAPPAAVIDAPAPQIHNSAFGRAVVFIDADTIAVGRAGEPGAQAGAVHVYSRQGPGWARTQTLLPTPANAPIPSAGGDALAYDEGTLVVGSRGSRVWIFERDPSGRFQEVGTVEGPVVSPDSAFGSSVACQADCLVVGDPTRNIAARAGSAYVYRRTLGTWHLEAELQASDGWFEPSTVSGAWANDRFGECVDIDDGVVVVGAPRGRQGSQSESEPGSAYVFESIGGRWVERYRLWHGARHQQNLFGTAVTVSGSTVAVGSPAGYWGTTRRGSLNIYHLPFGRMICRGGFNATGARSGLEITGSDRATIGHLTLRAKNLPPGSLVFPLGAQLSSSPNLDGHGVGLCLGSRVFRFSHLATRATLGGTLSLQLDPQCIPCQQQCLDAIAPGETWAFQLWYRDAGPGSSQVSHAVAAVFR